jgi:hypothetical protein
MLCVGETGGAPAAFSARKSGELLLRNTVLLKGNRIQGL